LQIEFGAGFLQDKAEAAVTPTKDDNEGMRNSRSKANASF